MFWFFFGTLLLLLFHFESISLGALKVSHLWKGLLLAFLMLKVTAGGKIRPFIYKPFLLLSLFILFSLEIIYNPLNAIFSFSTAVIIPLIGVYALQKSPAWNRKALHFLATFFILCFVPYELGVLSPLNEGYDIASSYGIVANGMIGPFQTVHAASTALAGALLVVLYFLLTSEYNRTWLVFLLLLGLYFLFGTYVRTGMAMFAVGALLMLASFSIRSNRMFLRVFMLVLIVTPLAGTWVFSNDALMARLLGKRVNSSELLSFETMGSGRGALALAALDIYAEADFIEKVIGMGITEQKERMIEKMGAPFIPHNGFLGVLLHQGVIGAMLFIWFLSVLWRAIGRLEMPQAVGFLRALFLAYLVMIFFQQYDILYMPVLLWLAFAWKLSVLHASRAQNFVGYSGIKE